jgi:hypothetical protein
MTACVLNREKAEFFLTALAPGTEHFTFQTFTDSEQARAKQKNDALARVLHGSLADHWNTLVALSSDGAGIFVVINETDFRGRATVNIVRVRAYFGDLDSADLTNLRRFGLRPHFVTRTSPGRYHAYWIVDGVALDQFRTTQQRLAKLIEGDRTVCDLPRVMRLPGFPHQKNPAQPFLVDVAPVEPGPPYREADFQTALAAAEVAHSNLPDPTQHRLAERLNSGNASRPDMHQGYPDGHRTRELTRRAGWCLGPGHMTVAETLKVCLAWNLLNTPPLAEDKVRSTVANIARAEAKKLITNGQSIRAKLGQTECESVIGVQDNPAEGNPSSDDAEIARLAQLPPLVYERERKEAAKRLGCREAILDKLVAAARGETGDGHRQGHALDLLDPEPWPEPVDGAALLSEISSLLTRYVVMSRAAADAIALWVMHAYLIETADVTPRLAIKSPEKRCGKTKLLSIIAHLAPRVLATSNISPAAMFRTIEAAKPTLLIDEADTFVAMSEDLRGIINGGHTRATAYVIRTVGEDLQPRRFSTWTPMAFATIGKLPGTVEDRSITVPLRRRRPDEKAERLRRDHVKRLHAIASRVARWTADHAGKIAEIDPEPLDRLHDRAADNWRPLLTIAEEAGGDWPERAQIAAVMLSADGAADQDSLRTMLLGDIRAYFQSKGTDRQSSDELVKHLISLDERPWSELHKGRPLTKAGLARLLKPFGILPTTIRFDGIQTAKGYYLTAFEDAFARYLAPETVTTSQS